MFALDLDAIHACVHGRGGAQHSGARILHHGAPLCDGCLFLNRGHYHDLDDHHQADEGRCVEAVLEAPSLPQATEDFHRPDATHAPLLGVSDIQAGEDNPGVKCAASQPHLGAVVARACARDALAVLGGTCLLPVLEPLNAGRGLPHLPQRLAGLASCQGRRALHGLGGGCHGFRHQERGPYLHLPQRPGAGPSTDPEGVACGSCALDQLEVPRQVCRQCAQRDPGPGLQALRGGHVQPPEILGRCAALRAALPDVPEQRCARAVDGRGARRGLLPHCCA
mmetsp:Transcript_103723/g.288753  ORF Transcript_103723/g.288753 Transcript_103723/m.288753 type:complete len:280 (+) Transcript_103723:1106-1945(+)